MLRRHFIFNAKKTHTNHLIKRFIVILQKEFINNLIYICNLYIMHATFKVLQSFEIGIALPGVVGVNGGGVGSFLLIG